MQTIYAIKLKTKPQHEPKKATGANCLTKRINQKTKNSKHSTQIHLGILSISYLAVVVSSDLKWEMGGSNSLRKVVFHCPGLPSSTLNI
jgi:hypothetical protein